ncbi:hypothetical protein Tco_0123255 [Tanacetum coccineum]
MKLDLKRSALFINVGSFNTNVVMRSRGFRHDGYDCFFSQSRSVETEGESSSNSLRQQRRRSENELAAVTDVLLSLVHIKDRKPFKLLQ